MTRNSKALRVGLLISSLAALAFILYALTQLRWEAAYCRPCGSRMETAKFRDHRVYSQHYQTRLGVFLKDQNVCPDCCPHQKLDSPREGGWEIFLAESFLYSDRND